MAKIYPEPKDRPRQNIPGEQWDPAKRTMGTYDQPKRKRPSRAMIFLIVIAIVIIVAMFLAGFAHGSEIVQDDSLPLFPADLIGSGDALSAV